MDAAEERPLVAVGHGLKVLRFQSREEETVDLAARPRGVLHRRRGDPGGRLKRPELPAQVDVDLALDDVRRLVARIGRAHLHPGLEVGDHRVGQLLLRRHLEVLILVVDRLDEQTFLRIARDDRRPQVAPLAHPCARVEEQVAAQLLGLGGMALVALLDQDRPDSRFEEGDALRCRRLLRGGGRGLLRLDPFIVRGRQTSARRAANQQAQKCDHSTHGTISRFDETRIRRTRRKGPSPENTARRDSKFQVHSVA